jgi:hypothetical protein
MFWVDEILDEFNGQISIEEIYKSTYKEIGYLRKHRKELNKNKNKNNPLGNIGK